MDKKFDVIVIGAGPGGYVAAIKCAKLGMNVAVVEEDSVGGTCLNRGCIPAKAMIHSSQVYREAKDAEELGVFVEGASYDYGKIVDFKQSVIDKLVGGVEQLFVANGVTKITGRGTLLADKKVQVGDEIYEAENVILATGSVPLIIPIPGIDLPKVITSNELYKLCEIPKSLVIVGGGVISMEFATVYANLGIEVTVLEALPKLLPALDKEISQNLKIIMKKRGVDIHTGAAVKSIEQGDGVLICNYEEKEQMKQIEADYVLCAVGRKANTEGILGEGVEAEMERGRFVVDEPLMTSIPGVYAIGDIVKGSAQLAHLASAHGITVAEHLAGEEPSVDISLVPGCVYADPEIACVGMTDDEAKEAGYETKVSKFIMSANGKSIISREERGFIKIVAEEGTNRILGCQMMCARATDMIGEFTTAIANGMTADQLLKGMRSHPTYNEGVGEALEELFGGAIHVAPRKKR